MKKYTFSEAEAKAFVGPKANYYLGMWMDHQDESYKGWNWAACCFRLEWLVYRKMYREAAILFGIILLQIFLLVLLEMVGIRIPSVGGKLTRLILELALGYFGNALYWKKAMRTLKEASELEANGRHRYLAQKGGTSVAAVFVVIIMELCLVAL